MKEVRLPYAEHEQMITSINQLVEALDKVKKAKNVVVLDYSKIKYHWENGGYCQVLIPTIEGDGIGAYANYKERFENDIQHIEDMYSEMRQEQIAHKKAYRSWSDKRDEFESKTRPWKIASVVLSLLLITRLLWDLIVL